MKKVYCIIFDYRGCDESVLEIREDEENAIARLVALATECEYDNVVDYMRESDFSLVEWECGSDKQRVIEPSYDW